MAIPEGPIRRILREGRLLKLSSNQGEVSISRKVLTDIIYHEEKASAEYEKLATNPVFNEGQRQLILGMANDEGRHRAAFTAILRTLEGEGKIV